MDLSQTTISSLPSEMIKRIFDYLPFADRLTASLTCSAWQQIAFSASFCRAIRIRIDDRNRQTALRDMRAYQKCRNVYVNCLCKCAVCNTGDRYISSDLECLVRTAPLESLSLSCRREPMRAILDDHMLWISALTALSLCVANSKRIPGKKYDELRISHPSLESLSIDDQSQLENFTINCPKVIELTIVLNSMKVVRVVTQLQKQLERLDITCDDDQCFEELDHMEFNNLKKLCLTFGKKTEFAAQSFNRMMNLVDLQMHNQSSFDMITGEELVVLKSLSILTLSVMLINTEGFTRALREMTSLKELELIQCQFIYPPESSRMKSEHVERLHIDYESEESEDSSFWLPSFPKLKTLSLSRSFGEEIDEAFQQICHFYPELEELRFAANRFAEQKFRSKTTFSHIRQLKFLKRLQLVGLDSACLDWTACSQLALEELYLERCVIRGADTHQMIASIGHRLRRLSLEQCDLCQPMADLLFNTSEFRLEGSRLRRLMPWCKVSYRDCKVIAEWGQGEEMDGQRSGVVLL